MQNKAVYYTVYQITNLVNAKIYIGKHQTYNINDSYYGSGKLLKRAIKKYGKENFKKEILHIFDNEDDMNTKEKELVSEEFVLQETNYNLCIGGEGGFSYLELSGKIHRYDSKEAIKNSKLAVDAKSEKMNDPKWQEQYKQNLSKGQKSRYTNGEPGTFKGCKHTNESLQKIKAAARNRKTNSQTGTRWITNGTETCKIKINDSLPDGWYFGRK